MAQNKEQLNKLALFIKRLLCEPGNEEFAYQLRKILEVSAPPSMPIESSKVAEIEKYLGLD